MIINLSDVLSIPLHESRSYKPELTMNEVSFMENIYPVQWSPLTLTISHEGKRRLGLQFDVNATVTMKCDRCLEEVIKEFHLEYKDVVDLDKIADQEAEEEASYIEDCNLDVDLFVIGELLLVMPMKVLCKEDCKGICSICGANLNQHPCDCIQEPDEADPRMAVFSDIFNQFKEV